MQTSPPHVPRFTISFPEEEPMSNEAHILHLKAHIPWWLPWITFVIGLALGASTAFGIIAFLVSHPAGT